MIALHMSEIKDESERAGFVALTTPLVDTADPFTKSRASCAPGAERVLDGFLNILREWTTVERWFCNGVSYADAVENLRKANKTDSAKVLQICRSHAQLKSTSIAVMTIIDSIAEAGKSDITSDKLTSVVLGADGLEDTTPCLTDIASMRGNETYDILSQRCRNVLIEESLPSIEERKNKVRRVVKSLGLGEEEAPKLIQGIINDNDAGADVVFPLMNEAVDAKEQLGILEVAARKMYQTYILKDFATKTDQKTLKFTFFNKPKASVFSSTSKITSMTDLTKAMSSSKLSDLNRSDSDSSLQSAEEKGEVPSSVARTAIMKICGSFADIHDDLNAFKTLLEEFPQYNGSVPLCESGPANILSVFILQNDPSMDQNTMAKNIELLLSRNLDDLEKADIRRVTFLVSKDSSDGSIQYPLPSVYTFRETADFKEDHLYRDIEPETSHQLEMLRLAKNFSLSCLGAHLSPTGQIYLYKATPKSSALAQDKKANKSPRIFARALSFVQDFSAGTFERLLVEAYNAIDSIKTAVPAGDNHLFINIVSDLQTTVIDPADVEQVVVSILKRHDERASRLGIAEVEAKAVCKLSEDSHPISLRMVGSNPTGFVQVMNTYVEAADETGNKRVFKSIGGTKANLACSGDSSWEDLEVNTPYPLTRPFDAQRKAALKSSDTLYCYDLPALFEAAVETEWASASGVGTSCPMMVMFTSELVVRKKTGGPWTMDDYLNGDLELVETQRKAGKNDVGMVAWLMTLKTVEYPTVSWFTFRNLRNLIDVILTHTNTAPRWNLPFIRVAKLF